MTTQPITSAEYTLGIVLAQVRDDLEDTDRKLADNMSRLARIAKSNASTIAAVGTDRTVVIYNLVTLRDYQRSLIAGITDLIETQGLTVVVPITA